MVAEAPRCAEAVELGFPEAVECCCAVKSHCNHHPKLGVPGQLANLTPTTVLGGNPSLLYPTTKSAIIQMMRAMAAQHGQENIRINCVCPGMVYTPMTRRRGMTVEMRQARINQNLMKKEGTG